jgi:hypothetical protein
MLPHGWFMVVIEADDLIVATAMATHDPLLATAVF